MPRHPLSALSAAAVAAALGLSGCTGAEPGSPSSALAAPPPAPAPVATRSAPAAPLPPPDALTDVLYRLADPGVPGTQKMSLIEGATADKAPALDQFATALLNGGYAPTTFTARDIAWSDRRSADVFATVDVSSPAPGTGVFTFPMEFKPRQGGWQLSQQTADVLLAFDAAQATPPPAPTP